MIFIKEKIEKWVGETLKEDVVLEHPKDLKNGDYYFHSTKRENDFAKILNEKKIPEVEKVESAGDFINFYLSKEFFAESVKEINEKGDRFGRNELLKGRKILIEHTQPNPFKEFHIGHLMNNAIGESVSRIIKLNGADTFVVGYHGDVGLHVAKAILGIIESPDRPFPQESATVGEKIVFFGMAYQLGSALFESN